MDLKFRSSSDNDNGDIIFYYNNGQEKMRIWTSNEYTSTHGPNFRLYTKDGTCLYEGELIINNIISTSFRTSVGNQLVYTYKVGRVVTLASTGDVYSLPKGINTAYTLPEGYRPGSNIEASINNVGSSDLRVSIYSNGTISYQNFTGIAINSAHNFGWHATYIAY